MCALIVELTPPQRKQFKARAHRLDPVVTIGDKGLTTAVLKEIDANLNSHELIKVKAAVAEREQRETLFRQICETLSAAPVQHIGKILVLHRENPEKKRAAPAKATGRRGRTASASASFSAERSAAEARAARPRGTGRGRTRSAGRTK